MICARVQDLKDHFRSAGDVVFTDSYNDGTGIVEFSRYEDFKRALRDMDDSKFRSHEVGTVSCHGCVCNCFSHRERRHTFVSRIRRVHAVPRHTGGPGPALDLVPGPGLTDCGLRGTWRLVGQLLRFA